MRKVLAGAVIAAAVAVGGGFDAAAAGPSAGAGTGAQPDGIASQRRGIATLQSLGLLSSVVRKGIVVVGVGTVPFKDVLALNRTNPRLFETGGVSLVVPGVGAVPATSCDSV